MEGCLEIEKKAEAAFQDYAMKLRKKGWQNVIPKERKRILGLLKMSGDLGMGGDREELQEARRVTKLKGELAETDQLYLH